MEYKTNYTIFLVKVKIDSYCNNHILLKMEPSNVASIERGKIKFYHKTFHLIFFW